MTPAGAAPLPTCRACGVVRAGPWCQACGQPGPEVPRSFGDVLSGQSGRLVHTLRLLLLRPGELAREIAEGRDRRSVRPLTLLLNLIPLFFVIGGGAGGFNARMFMDADPTGSMATIVAKRSAARNVPPLVVQEHIEQRFRSVYSLLVVVQAFAYGLAIGVAERRKRLPWLVHIGAAIHYMCVSFLVATVAFGVGRLGGVDIAHAPLAGALVYGVVIAYMTLMLRRAYAERTVVALGKALAILIFGYVVAIALSLTALLVALYTA